MPDDHVYSGRTFTAADITTIRRLISEHPHASRARLSYLVCEALDWRQRDGRFKAMRCRVVMLRMHEQGMICLPEPLSTLWRVAGEPTLRKVDPDIEPQAPITQPVHELLPLQIHRIVANDKRASRRCNSFILRYHYLGFQQTPGANLRYRIHAADGRELAFIIWASAAWKTAPRDRWIGWSDEQRKARLHLIINNTRFLILPWVRSPNLASHLLALFLRRVPNDWHMQFGYRPVLAETFVDTTRYTGHCYRAANWTCLGQTTGRSKWDQYNTLSVPKKDVWVYALRKNPQRLLCEAAK